MHAPFKPLAIGALILLSASAFTQAVSVDWATVARIREEGLQHS